MSVKSQEEYVRIQTYAYPATAVAIIIHSYVAEGACRGRLNYHGDIRIAWTSASVSSFKPRIKVGALLVVTCTKYFRLFRVEREQNGLL